MAHYGEFLQSLRRATTFRRWRRDEREPLGEQPPRPRHVIRAGRRPESPSAPLWRFALLAGPAVFTTGLGLAIQLYYDSGRQVWAHVPAPFFVASWTALCLVFAARAWAATDGRTLRLAAALTNLAFPLWLLVRAAT